MLSSWISEWFQEHLYKVALHSYIWLVMYKLQNCTFELLFEFFFFINFENHIFIVVSDFSTPL